MAVRVINNDSHFHREMSASGSKLVVVDFTASWCGPCQVIAPVFEQLASKYPRAIFLKVDVDKCQETAAAEGVSSIPTFIFYRNKATLDRMQGVNPSGLESKIQQFYGFGEEEGGHVTGHKESNMRWFEGDIAQAVTQSRAKNAVFVVFVEGQDLASKRIAAAIDNALVSEQLNGPSFICIKLQSETQTFNQFSQIYRDPPVPSLYFIGRNGSPIEIVTQTANANSLLEKILQIENVHFGRPSGGGGPSTTVSSTEPAGTSQTPEISSTSTAESIEEASNASDPSTSSAALEDRVERAKELLEEKRLKKKVQEEEEARQKEMQRRKEGQSVQELRRLQQEKELKELREERMRDKRLEQEARQRVLEQIAQDRAAKKARSASSVPSPATTQAATATAAPTSNSNEARLQFRLPDGSTHSNRFNADDTLADVRQYILSNITLPYRDFALATAFPRREFSSGDSASTLRELELVPSSVILIIPVGGSTAVQQSGPGLFGLVQTILMFVTYPVTQLFTLLRGFIFGTPPTASGANPSSSNSAGSAHSQSQGNAQNEKKSQRRSGGAYRRSGTSNVHRLHQNNSSSDDENNTWNGNSTQQM